MPNLPSATASVSSAPETAADGSTLSCLLGPSKLPGVGTTIFTLMSRLATEHGAINLGQGFPDFDGDPRLHQRVSDAMAGGANQYAPMAGIVPLRQAVAAKVESLHGHRYDAD